MATSRPRPGEVFLGKYRILRVVGEGGMGQVFAAHHTLLDKSVAIKVLSREVSEDREHVRRFLNEARLAARIKSPHVCSVMDVGQLDDGCPFLVMELLEGGDVSAALRARGPLPVRDIVEIALGALEGLVHAHVRGIVHRDLKPSNLFLSHEPDGPVIVKVLDFGISKFDAVSEDQPPESVGSGRRSILGSPAYMSPEQIRDARSVDARADIWSMGVILYELATGVCPFDAPTPSDTFGRILGDAIPVPVCALRPDVPAILDAAIARCIRRNPAERFVNVLELAQAIAPIVPGGDAAVARIAAIQARPKSSLADSSQGLPAIELPLHSHPTNATWEGSPARTTRKAVGVGVALGVAVLLAIGIVATVKKKKHTAATAAPVLATEVTDTTQIPSTTSVPAPLPSIDPSGSASAPAPADPLSSAAGGTSPAATARPVSRPGSAPHTGKPSKQDLLKDRR